tara:strand:+ start:332 stop:1579 length:1248 start_codon:yes stop_codon:yes gene_type:complete
MSYFNEINGYLSSLKESQNNEAQMANEMANKKAQTIEDKFNSINSSIESAGGILVAGADGWFKGRKILEKLGKAIKGKGSETGTDITTPQTKSTGMTTQTSSATTGDKAPSVADSDLSPTSFGRTINTSASTDGKISVPKSGLKRNQPSTKPDNNVAPEADAGGGGGADIGAPLANASPKVSSALSANDLDALKAGVARTTAKRGLPLSQVQASQSTDTQISSLADQVASKAGKAPLGVQTEDALSNIKSTTTPFGFNLDRPPPALGKPINGSTEGGGGSGGGSGGNAPSANLKDNLPDGDSSVSGNMDGISDSITSQIKQKGSQILKDGADSLGVDSDAVMGAANVALDGIPIIGEIFGIGTMIAGLARDIGDKGKINTKAEQAADSTPSSARGAVDTANVASTGATTAGSYIA